MNDLFGAGTLKVISIRQPWASLIVLKGKDIENRSWRTTYRGPIFIHAAQKRSQWQIADVERALGITIGEMPVMPVGGIIGIAEIVDCVSAHRSRWFEGPFGFVLGNVRALPFHSMRGSLSLFNPPQEVVERVYKRELAEYFAR
jgi:hypothetical protein